MVYNPLLGVGRDPQVRNAFASYRIKEDNAGLASASPFPGTTQSLAIGGDQKVIAVQIRIFPSSSGSSIDSARFRVKIDSQVVADYKLPNSDAWLNYVDDIVNVDILTASNSQLVVEYGPELGDATGYNIGFAVTAFTLTV